MKVHCYIGYKNKTWKKKIVTVPDNTPILPVFGGPPSISAVAKLEVEKIDPQNQDIEFVYPAEVTLA